MTRRPPTVALALVALAVVLARAALRHGALLVHQCVPSEGAAGALGVRLALLRPDADCPGGTLALGGDGRQVAGVVVLVALPVLLAHVATLAAGLGVLARLGGLVRSVAALLGLAPRRVPQAPALLVRRARGVVVGALRAVRAVPGDAAPWRRGPPLALAA